MPRDIHDDTAEALSGETLAPIGMVELEFDSGTVRFWTGIGEIAWDGDTYYGTGTLGKIGAVEETTEVRAVGVQLELSGIDSAAVNDDGDTLIDIVRNETWQARPLRIHYAVLNGREFVGEPFQIFGGRMDQMEILHGATTTIRLSCESQQIDLQRTKVRRYTAEDQRAEYPGDKGCDYVAALQDVSIRWGRGE